MSFLNNPQNNPIKVIVLIIIIAIAGYFIYNAVHQNSLENQGRIVSSATGTTGVVLGSTTAGTATGTSISPLTGTTTGTTTTGGGVQAGGTIGIGTTTGKGVNSSGTTKGGTTGSTNCTATTSVALTASMGAGAPVPTSVTTGSGGVLGGDWMNVNVMNPSPCTVILSQLQFNLGTNDLTAWSPIQSVKLYHGATQLGTTLNIPGSGTMTVGPALLTFNFAGATAVSIPAGTTATFNLTGDSRNVDAQEYGYSIYTGVGTPVYFSLQLAQLRGRNSLVAATFMQSYTAGTIPLLLTPHVNIY